MTVPRRDEPLIYMRPMGYENVFFINIIKLPSQCYDTTAEAESHDLPKRRTHDSGNK